MLFAFRRDDNITDIQVLVGTNNLKSGGQKYGINLIISHENYNQTNRANDIAMVKVSGPIAFNANVHAIKLPSCSVARDSENLRVTISGWGAPSVS